MSRRLRLGMVGGGEGAFIGNVHRMAARLDDRYELVAGALSSDAQRAARSAAALHIEPARSYASFHDMALAEARRGDRIDVVAIVTPNHLHYAVARAFLEAGIHVICDKPLATNVADAHQLAGIVERSGLVFALTHNYSGCPLARHARHLVAQGALGDIRVIQIEYAQDWLAEPLEATGHKQAAWRTDPLLAGAGCLGDIGTHAFQLASFVTGLHPSALACDASSFVPGRRVDDNVHLLLRYATGARGMLWASQVATGCQNRLVLRVFGSRASFQFSQEHSDELIYTELGRAPQRLTRGHPMLGIDAAWASRLPAGHPEGYLEAFAQIYRDVAELITAGLQARAPDPRAQLVPGVMDGVRGVEFIAAALRSASRDGAWIGLDGCEQPASDPAPTA